jgi:hypothetical protein
LSRTGAIVRVGGESKRNKKNKNDLSETSSLLGNANRSGLSWRATAAQCSFHAFADDRCLFLDRGGAWHVGEVGVPALAWEVRPTVPPAKVPCGAVCLDMWAICSDANRPLGGQVMRRLLCPLGAAELLLVHYSSADIS